MKKIKRALSLALCGAMLLSNFPAVSFAVEADDLREHHTALIDFGHTTEVRSSIENTSKEYQYDIQTNDGERPDSDIIASGGFDSVDWYLEANGTLTFAPEFGGDFSIPDSIAGTAPWYPYRSSIKQIRFVGDGSVTIGSYAFYGLSQLETIMFPDEGCNAIGKSAFENCRMLKDVHLWVDFGRNEIGERAFYNCRALEEVSFNVDATIGKLAFSGCANLDSIYLLCDDIVSISEASWRFCPQADSFNGVNATIFHPEGYVVQITDSYGGNLTWKSVNAGVCGNNVRWQYDKSTNLLTISGTGNIMSAMTFDGFPWRIFKDSISCVVVGEGICKIPAYCFEYMRNVTNVKLPDTLTWLSVDAFNRCTSLNNLFIPKDVSHIEGYNLAYCESLTDIYFAGTQDEWLNVDGGEATINKEESVNLHHLVLHEDLPTCTEDGTQSYYQFDDTSVYGGMYNTNKELITQLETIPALGHTESIDKAVSATCIADGLTEGSHCSSCGEVFVAQKLIPAGHKNVESEICAGCGLYGFCGENVNWSLDTQTGTMTISGEGAMADFYVDKTTPPPWDAYRSEITSLVIENGVTAIGECAFSACRNLKSIDLGQISSINRYAFGFCTGLSGELIIPDSVTYIGEDVFSNCSGLTSVTLRGDLASIGPGAFDSCNNITTITFTGTTAPNSCSLGHLYGLKDIYVPGESIEAYKASIKGYCPHAALQAVGSEITQGTCGENLIWAFDENISTLTISGTGAMENFKSPIGAPWSLYGHRSKIETVVIEDGIISIGDYAFRYCDKLEGELVIPDSVTTVGQGAFLGCGSIDVSIGSGLKEIPESAFANSGITTIDFGAITTIGNYAFSNCDGLDGDLVIPDTIISMGSSVFEDCDGIDTLTLGKGLTALPFGAFRSCDDLKSIDVGNITVIPSDAFSGCKSLASIDLKNVTSIEPEAFSGCDSLVELLIPDTVTTIYFNGFGVCKNLESVTLGSGLTELGVDATIPFHGCIGLREITFTGSTVPAIAGDFTTLTALEVVYVPADSLDAYSTALNGKLPDGAVIKTAKTYLAEGSCGENLVWTLSEAGTLTISGEGSMGNYSTASDQPWYDYQTRLTELVIEDGVTSVGNCAFDGCTNLATINWGKITSIGNYAFYNCDGLTGSLTIPDSITRIGLKAFYDCDGLDGNLLIPNGVTSMDSGAFVSCDGIDSLTIGCGLKSIPYGAFTDCSSLKTIDFCSVTSIGENAFWGCSHLTEASFSESITSIGAYSFGNCFDLSTIHFSGNAPSIGSHAFQAVTADAYYPADDSTWVKACQNYGGTITWVGYGTEPGETVPTEPVSPTEPVDVSGTCGENLTWSFDKDTGTLTISGTGYMWNFEVDKTPWDPYLDQIVQIVVEEGVLSIGSDAFWGCDILTSVTLPEGLLSLEGACFLGCQSLKQIDLPDTLEILGEQAFFQCFKLETIDIPASVKTIGDIPFGICESLTAITVDSDNQYYCNDENGYLFSKDKTVLHQVLCNISGSYTVPDGVRRINRLAFDECRWLTEIIIPDSVMEIGDCTFAGCRSLKNVRLPSNLSRLEGCLFTNCLALENITIPAGVKYIDYQIFANVAEHGGVLSDIIFEGSAPKIAEVAFESVVITAYYPNNNPTWISDMMQNYGGTITWVPYAGELDDDTSGGIGDYPPELKWFFDKLIEPDNYLWATGYYAKIMEQYG